MNNALIDFHTELADSKDKDAAWGLLLDFARALGMAHVHTWSGAGLDVMAVKTTCPDWWAPHYIEQEFWKKDVLWWHGLHGHGPLTYGVDAKGNNPALPDGTVEIVNFGKHVIDLGSGFGFPVFKPDGQRIGGINLGISGTLEELKTMPSPHIMAAIMATTAVYTKSYAMDRMGLDSASLTPRESECLLWLSKGLRTKEISDKLNLSDYTVSFHLNNAKAKLGAETREQAVARAVVLGLIVP